MLKIKTAVLVSGGGTNLQALIDAEKNGLLETAEISLVISNKEGVLALERADKAGIKIEVISKKEFPNQMDFEEKLNQILVENQIELIVLAGFMSILSGQFTDRYVGRIINIHPSLIPSFCGKGFYGLKVHEEALKYGVKITGATVHYVNETPDGGQIIMQKAVEILEDDSPKTLQQRVMKEAEHIILPQATEQVARRILKEREEK